MTRHRIDNRRPSERIEFTYKGKRGSVIVGFPVDGLVIADHPGEIFIIFDRVGSEIEALARDAGLILSIAMQHGIDLRAYALSITRTDSGEPASLIGAAIDAIVETYWSVSGGSDGKGTSEPGGRTQEADAGAHSGHKTGREQPIPDEAHGHGGTLRPASVKEAAAALSGAAGAHALGASGQGEGV